MSDRHPEPSRILLVEDDPSHANLIERTLRGLGHDVTIAATGADAFAALTPPHPYALIVLDWKLPDVEGIDVLEWVRARDDDTPIVFSTSVDDVKKSVRAMRGGATDYVVKHFEGDGYLAELAQAIGRLLEHRPPPTAPRPRARTGLDAIAGASPGIEEVRARIRSYAPDDQTVLILGETGVGKELVAQAIHELSPRANGPLVTLNAAAIESLSEAQLFGIRQGTATDVRENPGYLGEAEGGTLFLDEIGDLPKDLQAKLLRVLESRRYRQIGARADRGADVRFVAATHRDLKRMADEGSFRLDLFFRLEVLCIEIPPLRNRRQDIPIIAERLLRQKLPDASVALGAGQVAQLMAAPWRGNVRELKNAVDRAVARYREEGRLVFETSSLREDADVSRKISCQRLVELLQVKRGRLGDVAQELGVSIRTVQRRMDDCHLNRRDFVQRRYR